MFDHGFNGFPFVAFKPLKKFPLVFISKCFTQITHLVLFKNQNKEQKIENSSNNHLLDNNIRKKKKRKKNYTKHSHGNIIKK